jgi:hypothetical protein
MKKKLVFIGLALILIVSTVTTFAVSSLAAGVSITADSSTPAVVQSVGGAGGNGVPNTIKLQYSTGSSPPYTQVPPTWSPSKKHAGNITAGDVYYVDCTGSAANVRVTIYVTNSGKLVNDYTYLNMQVNIRAGSSGIWTQATTADDSTNATDYLTFDKSAISFILIGSTHYDISIDGGDFYCSQTLVDATHDISPQFYVNVEVFK